MGADKLCSDGGGPSCCSSWVMGPGGPCCICMPPGIEGIAPRAPICMLMLPPAAFPAHNVIPLSSLALICALLVLCQGVQRISCCCAAC